MQGLCLKDSLGETPIPEAKRLLKSRPLLPFLRRQRLPLRRKFPKLNLLPLLPRRALPWASLFG